jgi:hypothetical protein
MEGRRERERESEEREGGKEGRREREREMANGGQSSCRRRM